MPPTQIVEITCPAKNMTEVALPLNWKRIASRGAGCICLACGKLRNLPLYCEGCGIAVFCGRECQQAALSSHKGAFKARKAPRNCKSCCATGGQYTVNSTLDGLHVQDLLLSCSLGPAGSIGNAFLISVRLSHSRDKLLQAHARLRERQLGGSHIPASPHFSSPLRSSWA